RLGYLLTGAPLFRNHPSVVRHGSLNSDRERPCRAGGGLARRIVLCNEQQEDIMLWTIFVVLLILWLLGFSFSVGGSLIHLLLVIALVVLVINLLSGRRGIA
ncbi:MAG TPA: lmo0937 family membrane protein, partial [Bryobacteraceae bacterium]|nr:lmo0937 family membrane protein [Bryobacteraceae bacterium]